MSTDADASLDASQSGTRTVSAAHPIDVDALQAWLSRHVPGFQGPLQIAQFKGGQSNPTYELTTPNARYVLRAKPGPASKLLASAHAAARADTTAIAQGVAKRVEAGTAASAQARAAGASARPRAQQAWQFAQRFAQQQGSAA